MYGGEFGVDLRAKTCSCKRWDLCGIPCPHAISAIFQRNEDIEDNVDKLYKKEGYLKTYGPIIGPVPSIDQWPRSSLPAIKPPNFRIQPGRTRKVRTKEPGEVEIPASVPPNPKTTELETTTYKAQTILYQDSVHKMRSRRTQRKRM
ncbi:unnamed protein product [Prunus armeniaca]